MPVSARLPSLVSFGLPDRSIVRWVFLVRVAQ